MSNLQTLRTQLRQEMRVDPNGRIHSDNILNRNINQAIRQVQQDGDYQWHFNDAENTESTVVSQANYTLPSDFVRIEEASVRWKGIRLTPRTFNFLKEGSLLTVDGQPSYYALRGNAMYIAQPPNAIEDLTYNYRKQLPTMDVDSDDSGIPVDFDEAITQFAAYLSWQDFAGKQDFSIQAVQSYNEMIKGLFAQYLGRRDESNFNMSFEVPNIQYNNVY